MGGNILIHSAEIGKKLAAEGIDYVSISFGTNGMHYLLNQEALLRPILDIQGFDAGQEPRMEMVQTSASRELSLRHYEN